MLHTMMHNMHALQRDADAFSRTCLHQMPTGVARAVCSCWGGVASTEGVLLVVGRGPQAYLWNHAVSHRVRTYGVGGVVEGDLVLPESLLAVEPQPGAHTLATFPLLCTETGSRFRVL